MTICLKWAAHIENRKKRKILSLISLFYFVLYINMFTDEAAYAEKKKDSLDCKNAAFTDGGRLMRKSRRNKV
jgi:hypothetical protein